MEWGGVVGVVEDKAISAQPTELELDWAGLSLAIFSNSIYKSDDQNDDAKVRNEGGAPMQGAAAASTLTGGEAAANEGAMLQLGNEC